MNSKNSAQQQKLKLIIIHRTNPRCSRKIYELVESQQKLLVEFPDFKGWKLQDSSAPFSLLGPWIQGLPSSTDAGIPWDGRWRIHSWKPLCSSLLCQDSPRPLGHGEHSDSHRNLSSGNFTVQITGCTERSSITHSPTAPKFPGCTVFGMHSPRSQPLSHLNVIIRGCKSDGFQVLQAPQYQCCTLVSETSQSFL